MNEDTFNRIAEDDARRIVCAACRSTVSGDIVIGIRHWCPVMKGSMKNSRERTWVGSEEGFVDQRGNFLTREEAWIVAKRNDQIIRSIPGEEGVLYSENLY